MLLRRLFTVSALMLFGCDDGNKDNCPGQCLDLAAVPTMTISTEGGAATIAKAEIVSGPCTHLLLRSSGEAGVPHAFATVQVSYNGPATTPPLCIVSLTSTYGQTEAVAVQVKARPAQTCCPYGACCPKSAERSSVRLQFEPPTREISFPPPPDGGVEDASSDAPITEDAAEGDANDETLDVATTDVEAIDLAGLDGVVDVALPIDAPIDA